MAPLLSLALAAPVLASSTQSVTVTFKVQGTACLTVSAPQTAITNTDGGPALSDAQESAPIMVTATNCGSAEPLTLSVPSQVGGVPLASSVPGFRRTDAHNGDELDVLAVDAAPPQPSQADSLGANGGTLTLVPDLAAGKSAKVAVAVLLGPNVSGGSYTMPLTFGVGQ